MTKVELKAIIDFLKTRITLSESQNTVNILFNSPDQNEISGAGISTEGMNMLLSSNWWHDMENDIINTPDFCDPDDPPDQILKFAQDVVTEYIGKNFNFDK